MLWLIGLGLGDEKDITVRALEVVKRCTHVYLEAYTSILGMCTREKLEEFYGREVIEADRELVEQGADDSILRYAKEGEVAFLVVGDVFGATTHSDLCVRAVEMGIEYKVIHNTSIMNAVGCCGLQLYRFGEAVSIVFFTESWRPDSFYDRIKANRNNGLHTLCLLDIKVKEQSEENLLRGRLIFEPPRFMTVNQCVEQLLEVEEKRGEGVYGEDTLCVGLARVGTETQQVVSGTMKDLLNVDFGPPLHSLVIAGDVHFLEKEHLDFFSQQSSVAAAVCEANE